MTKHSDHQRAFQPGRGYSQEDWDSVPSQSLTAEELAALQPARDVLPQEFFESVARQRAARGRPPAENAKRQVTLRLDADVVETFRKQGRGWQTRMNDALRKAAGL